MCVCVYVWMCMCVCVYVCMCVCMYVRRLYVCMYICMYVFMHAYMYVWVCGLEVSYVRTYVHIQSPHVLASSCVCMCTYIHVRCLYVCLFVWMCVCMYACTYASRRSCDSFQYVWDVTHSYLIRDSMYPLTYMGVCVYAPRYLCMDVCMYIYACCTHVCMYVCMYVRMYVCMYVCTRVAYMYVCV